MFLFSFVSARDTVLVVAEQYVNISMLLKNMYLGVAVCVFVSFFYTKVLFICFGLKEKLLSA